MKRFFKFETNLLQALQSSSSLRNRSFHFAHTHFILHIRISNGQLFLSSLNLWTLMCLRFIQRVTTSSPALPNPSRPTIFPLLTFLVPLKLFHILPFFIIIVIPWHFMTFCHETSLQDWMERADSCSFTLLSHLFLSFWPSFRLTLTKMQIVVKNVVDYGAETRLELLSHMPRKVGI